MFLELYFDEADFGGVEDVVGEGAFEFYSHVGFEVLEGGFGVFVGFAAALDGAEVEVGVFVEEDLDQVGVGDIGVGGGTSADYAAVFEDFDIFFGYVEGIGF